MTESNEPTATVSPWQEVPYDVEMAIRADERRRLEYKLRQRAKWLHSRNKESAAYTLDNAATALFRTKSIKENDTDKPAA